MSEESEEGVTVIRQGGSSKSESCQEKRAESCHSKIAMPAGAYLRREEWHCVAASSLGWTSSFTSKDFNPTLICKNKRLSSLETATEC